MQTISLVITGFASLVAGGSVISTLLGRRRLRVATRLLAQHEQNDSERQRILSALERGQSELASANAQVQAREVDCTRLQHDLVQQEEQASETRQQLFAALDRYSTLTAEHQKLREVLNKVSAAQVELQAERKHHEESKKALTAARADVDRLKAETAEARKQLASERIRLNDKEKQHTTTQSQVAKLNLEMGELLKQVAATNERVNALQLVDAKATRLEARNAELETELAQVIQVTGNASDAELDREELQVRLETAAYSVRLASKEADRYRTRTEGLEVEIEDLRGELSSAMAAALQQERLLVENRKLSDTQVQQEQQLQSLQARIAETRRTTQEAELRAAEAVTELEHAQRLVQEGELERQSLVTQVETLGHYSEQVKRMCVELDALSQADQRGRDAEAEVVRLKNDLQKAQTALRSAESSSIERGQLSNVSQLLREEQQSHLEAEQRLLAAQEELRLLGSPAAYGKRAEVEQLERLREENYKLRNEAERLRIHETASRELDRLTVEHKRLRLESELLTRRVDELKSAQIELAELRRQWTDQSVMLSDAREMREQQSMLEAQLYALGQTPHTKRARPSCSTPIEIGNKAHELEERLSPLLAQWGLRSVVLADAGGFPIVVAGDPLAQEGLAAFSALVSDVGQRACHLLPFGNVLWVNWVDVNGMAVSCRLFSLGQEDFAVAAIGPEGLDRARADELVAVLRQILTSSLAPGDGPA